MPRFTGWFSQQEWATVAALNGVSSSVSSVSNKINVIGNGTVLKGWSEGVRDVTIQNVNNQGIIYIYYSMERYKDNIRGYVSFPVNGCNGRRIGIHNRGGENADRNYDGWFDITYTGTTLRIISGTRYPLNIHEVRKMG